MGCCWRAQVLIDPVCFLTCYPQLLYSFVYKVPMLKETLSSVTGLLSAARFLFSRDLIIAEVCSIPRVFHGYHPTPAYASHLHAWVSDAKAG